MEQPKLNVGDLTAEEKDALLTDILEVLCPGGDRDHECGSDEIGNIINLFHAYNLIHTSEST